MHWITSRSSQYYGRIIRMILYGTLAHAFYWLRLCLVMCLDLLRKYKSELRWPWLVTLPLQSLWDESHRMYLVICWVFVWPSHHFQCHERQQKRNILLFLILVFLFFVTTFMRTPLLACENLELKKQRLPHILAWHCRIQGHVVNVFPGALWKRGTHSKAVVYHLCLEVLFRVTFAFHAFSAGQRGKVHSRVCAEWSGVWNTGGIVTSSTPHGLDFIFSHQH